ncbi:MAG: hypothetical protein NVS3B20_03480 [Polyangiales bacterium]
MVSTTPPKSSAWGHTLVEAPNAKSALLVALMVSTLATAASWYVKETLVGTAVGGVFLFATWWLVLRHREIDVRRWGLAFGGLLEVPRSEEDRTTPLAPTLEGWRSVAREGLIAIGWALLLCALFFPPFVFAFARWWHVRHLAWVLPPKSFDVVVGQLVVIALPEEAFFRGYLQSALDAAWPRRVHVLGAKVGFALLVSSAVFAAGHLATIPQPARLAVFFPSLVFGWLRARTGGIGAGVLFHASCNLLSEGLARGSGL